MSIRRPEKTQLRGDEQKYPQLTVFVRLIKMGPHKKKKPLKVLECIAYSMAANSEWWGPGQLAWKEGIMNAPAHLRGSFEPNFDRDTWM